MSDTCACGCGQPVAGMTRRGPKRFVSGHNLRTLPKTAEHKRKIGEGQRRAWATTRNRLPVGATWIDRDGYVRVKVVEGSGAWRMQHALVMERMIGRSLRPGEVVHHINGVRNDNRPENLFLCANRSHHNRIEATLAEVFRELLADGVVRFNPEAGRYERVETDRSS